MNFRIQECNIDFTNGAYTYNNSTLMYSEFKAQFQLLLGEGYHVSLDLEKETGKCISLYCTLPALSFKTSQLVVNVCNKAELYYDKSGLQGSGCHYVPFVQDCFYDKVQQLIAFGDICSEGNIYEISKDTFAKIQNGNLLAVYAKINLNIAKKLKF